LIERHHAALFPPSLPAPLPVLALAAASLLLDEQAPEAGAHDPWARSGGWRMNGVLERALDFADEAGVRRLAVGYAGAGWRVGLEMASAAMTLVERHGRYLVLKLDGATVRGTVVREADMFHVFSGGVHHALRYSDPLAHAGEAEAEGGRLTAPMPGKIVALLVAPGDSVEKGAPLLIMEAMKMEHTIAAPADGTVQELLYAVGDQVADGARLLAFTPA
jgi:3-methylcrotonyl-CoA carboxylase alpha subunit